jgi:cation/acetate symporter
LGKVLKEVENNWWFVPLRNPAIIAMPLSFGIAVVASLFTSEAAADDRFDEMRNRILFGAPRVPQAAE